VNRFRYPEGPRLPALEKNILKYRAFEMVLMLSYTEHLKETVIHAIIATDRWTKKGAPRLTKQSPKKLRRAVAALVEDGILTKKETKEVVELVNFRNKIAHNVQELTFDVSRDTWARQVQQFDQSKYDYGALKRLKWFVDELQDRMGSKYVHTLSMATRLFSSAEQTYEGELKRLRRKIDGQIVVRKRRNARLKDEISLKGTVLGEKNNPAHPLNTARNGNLTKRGVEVCFRLFDAGKNPLAVATLMFISTKAARKRRKQWLQAGGNNRRREESELLPF
jgi:uncharacterized protein YutE (UPF0331/DUF86 family)